MGFFALQFWKGRQARVHKSSKSSWRGKRAAGPPEGRLEGSNKAAGGRARANVALSVRLDLLLSRPVAGDSDKPLMGDFRPGGLWQGPSAALVNLLGGVPTAFNCFLDCNRPRCYNLANEYCSHENPCSNELCPY